MHVTLCLLDELLYKYAWLLYIYWLREEYMLAENMYSTLSLRMKERTPNIGSCRPCPCRWECAVRRACCGWKVDWFQKQKRGHLQSGATTDPVALPATGGTMSSRTAAKESDGGPTMAPNNLTTRLNATSNTL